MARSALLENGLAASAIKRKMASACCRKRRSKVRGLGLLAACQPSSNFQ